MNVHFIAIGGAAMHNLALALHQQGHKITGSDDEIFDPSRSRLAAQNLLPQTEGWHAERVDNKLDAVIVGMHAKEDNPELQKAIDLKLPVFSFPEFLYQQTRNKKRVVIAGSHGKTTVTSMIMHVLKEQSIPFDYMVGAQIEGFETMVGFSDKSHIAIFEGDEYLTSPLDKRSKFMHYHPDIAVINGIAWDHINVFPTFESYLNTFRNFINSLHPQASLYYFSEDQNLKDLTENKKSDIKTIPYTHVKYTSQQNNYQIQYKGKQYPLQIIGRHNMQNIEAAHKVCCELGINSEVFFASISTFKGAARRLEPIQTTLPIKIYRDFAHAPSKVKATTEAIREAYPTKEVIAILELHTYSSLTKSFLADYKNALNSANQAVVYYNPHTLKIKRLPAISKEEIMEAFQNKSLIVFDNEKELSAFFNTLRQHLPDILLLMSSGNFSNLNITKILEQSTPPVVG